MDTQSLRSSKKTRLWVIGILIAVAVALLFFIKNGTAKIILGVVIALLVGAFGMEATNHDYDVGKMVETGSLSASKIERDQNGNLTNVDAFCNAKEADYNCADFKTQSEAMQVYNRCKTLGKDMDIYGLDRDNDGRVCESLPVGAQ